MKSANNVKIKIIFYIFYLLLSGANIFAQSKQSLVPNPGNNGGVTAHKSYNKKPLYTSSFFDDNAPPIPPHQMLLKRFTMQQYDHEKRLHFGFTLNFGALDYKVISNLNQVFFVDIAELSPALGVSALLDYRLHQNLSVRLQLGPTFGTRKLNYYENNTLIASMQLESVLLEMPIMLKYKARRNSDFRPYMVGGLVPYFDVAALKDFNESRKLYVALNPLDIAYTIGAGVDIYAYFFKMSVELRYVAGMLNTLSPRTLVGYEQFPSAIDKMQMRSFMLSLIFE
ncbi:MAG: outer membrane beta-barrel protein [Bacteroidales bacterium]